MTASGPAPTRAALVEVAERLFVEHGYTATSLDAIAAGAEVTKGALYHHFSGKQAIFEAAFQRVEQRATAAVAQATAGVEDPWLGAQAGLRAFLDVVRQPGYRRVVLTDGPSVLGHERLREQEATTYALVGEIVRSVLASQEQALEEEMVDTFTRIFFGALSASGGAVAASGADAAAAADRVEAAVGFILTGLRELLEAGRGPLRRPPGPGPTSRT